MSNKSVPLRVANTLLNALRAGVVPRIGLEHIMVGRRNEISALVHDIETVQNGAASIRFIVGNYGSGKSFMLQAIRNYAIDKGFVVVDADLSPERRLLGNRNEGLATYKELMKNMSTKAFPDGGALPLLLQRWISVLKTEVMEENQITADDASLNSMVEIKIYRVLAELQTIVNGFDFARVVSLYWKASVDDDSGLKDRALKWMQGGYPTKTEAKNDLGVGIIITDNDWYEYIKLFALFVVKAGYKGMLVLIDELVYISELSHTNTRRHNYEKILTLYNDAMQGKVKHLGIIMSATPRCLEDSRKGLFSYPALKSRLEDSRFSDSNTHDLLAPVIRLKALDADEIYVLIEKLEQIHCQVHKYPPRLSHEEMAFFIQNEFSRVGADENITPREIIKDFIEILNIILQNPDRTMRGIFGGADFAYAKSGNNEDLIQDEFKGFEV